MSSRVGVGGPIRRRSARILGKAADVKPYDPDVLQRHFHDDPMHLAIKSRDFDCVQELLDAGDTFCRRKGLNCYKLAGDDPTNVFADSGLHGALSEMHRAIVRQDFELVQRLLDKGDTFCTADGLNCFILAASDTEELWGAKARWRMVEKMLRIHSRGILSRDEDGLTLLNYFWTDLDSVKQIIDMGVDLNAVNEAGQTLCVSLFWAPLQNTLNNSYNESAHLPQLWKLMMRYEEFQQQVVEQNFFRFFVTKTKKSFLCQVILFDILELNLINIDLNFVEEYSEEMIHLFCADISHDKDRQQDAHLKLWNMLVNYKEFQDLVKDIDPEIIFTQLEQSNLAKQMFKDIDKLGLMSVDQLTIKLKMHPLFYIMENNNIHTFSYLSLIEFLLTELKKEDDNSILNDKTILNSKKVSVKNVRNRAYLKVKDMLHTPDNITFDVISFFLFSLPKFYDGSFRRNGKDLIYYLKLFIEKGFVPVGKPGVVHPIYALFYTGILKYPDDIYSFFDEYEDDNLQPKLLLQAIYVLKAFPFPHRQVLDTETGHQILDVHLLLTLVKTPFPSLIWSPEIGTSILDCVGALMPLSPVHPLQHFTAFHSIDENNRSDYYVIKKYCQFLLYTFEACGRHKFQAVDKKTIESVNLFYEKYEKLKPDEKESLKNCGLVINSSKAENEVGSLRWLSILQIRKTLFLNRSSTKTFLPSLIRTLFAEGFLPKGLEADLLVYKPNQKFDF